MRARTSSRTIASISARIGQQPSRNWRCHWGVQVDPQYRDRVLQWVAAQAAAKKRRQVDKETEKEAETGDIFGQDDHFAFIVGYTSGGVPYGITWEEWEEMEGSDEPDAK